MLEKTHATTRFGAKFLATAGAFALVVAGVAISAPASAADTGWEAVAGSRHSSIYNGVSIFPGYAHMFTVRFANPANAPSGSGRRAVSGTLQRLDPVTGQPTSDPGFPLIATAYPNDFTIMDVSENSTPNVQYTSLHFRHADPEVHVPFGYYEATLTVGSGTNNNPPAVTTTVTVRLASAADTPVAADPKTFLERELIAGAPNVLQNATYWTNVRLKTGEPLPNGITLAENGTLSGTPDQAFQQMDVTFQYLPFAADPADPAKWVDFSVNLKVEELPFQIISPNTITGEVGSVVNHQILTQGSEGLSPTFTLQSGSSLPEGLTLNSENGIISGYLLEVTSTPVEFTVMATLPDEDATFARQKITLIVNSADGEKRFTTNMLELQVENGAVVNHRFVVNATLPTVKFTITEGVLPKGLELNADSGVLSGTVDDADGVYPFTVTATITPADPAPAALGGISPAAATFITQANTIWVGQTVDQNPTIAPTAPANGGASSLAATGSSVPFVATGIALLAALAGAVVLVVRRRQDV